MQLIKEIDKKLFPLFPQLRVIRIGYDSPVFPALELRVLQGVGQKGVIMQDGSNIHDVCVGVPRLHHGLVEPVQELLPLFRCVDVLIVLDIVQDNKVRTPAPVFPSSKFLSGSYCIHLDAIGRLDRAALPGVFPLHAAEVLNDVSIVFQFILDIFQECLRLVR